MNASSDDREQVFKLSKEETHMTRMTSNGPTANPHLRTRGIATLTLPVVFFLLMSACWCTRTFAGPQGGDVVAGTAAITRPDAVTTNIAQATEKAIINWGGFSIDVNELVKFLQPNASSVALNRVTGADPSTILGQLLANGRVFLVNPNGVVFGPGSKVDVGALIATTFDITNNDFLSGKYAFLQKPGKDPSYIINKGQIKVADNGFVFLVAPGVKNEGLIIANIGKVVLGSGNKFTVDFQGDGLITYAISGKVIEKVKGPDGKLLTSAVSNSGKISSKGGEVVLTGDAAKEVVSSVINQEGVIEAQSLANAGGKVKLVGGSEGIVQNTGTIDVSAAEAGAQPGEVSITGEYAGNFGTILARGAEGAKGGNVSLDSTTQTLVSSDAVIDVSGGVDSSGGA
ncbi:MAG: filamentous hemagglutinin N-terminal domain-containing protein, partial [bacterium]